MPCVALTLCLCKVPCAIKVLAGAGSCVKCLKTEKFWKSSCAHALLHQEWEVVGTCRKIFFVTGFSQEKSLGDFSRCGFQSKHERNSFPLQYLDWPDWTFCYQPPRLPPADFKKRRRAGGDETPSASTTACGIRVSVSDQLQGRLWRRKCGEAELGAGRGAGMGWVCWVLLARPRQRWSSICGHNVFSETEVAELFLEQVHRLKAVSKQAQMCIQEFRRDTSSGWVAGRNVLSVVKREAAPGVGRIADILPIFFISWKDSVTELSNYKPVSG